MYQGFNLALKNALWDGEHLAYGALLHAGQRKQVKTTIDAFADHDGVLDASKMQANWFPQIDAQIFISHSHADATFALGLAGWLKTHFDLVSFIDSCAWGYADDLLALVDRQFCRNPGGETYSYSKRNRSTSHVHMMLSTALATMMDKCECLFFLNTPSSITPADVIEAAETGTTTSPWIYSEIAMSGLIRRKSMSQHRRVREDARAVANSLPLRYDVSVSHLESLNARDLDAWRRGAAVSNAHPLDLLYRMKRLPG